MPNLIVDSKEMKNEIATSTNLLALKGQYVIPLFLPCLAGFGLQEYTTMQLSMGNALL